MPFAADLADATTPHAELIAAVEKALGPIDVLVNNAAACYYIPFEKVSDKRSASPSRSTCSRRSN